MVAELVLGLVTQPGEEEKPMVKSRFLCGILASGKGRTRRHQISRLQFLASRREVDLAEAEKVVLKKKEKREGGGRPKEEEGSQKKEVPNQGNSRGASIRASWSSCRGSFC